MKRAWLLLTAGLAVGIVGLWIYPSADRPVNSTSPLTAVPFTSLAGQEVAPTFSQNRTHIAFAWSPEGLQDQFDLYVKVIGSENAAAAHPSFSPSSSCQRGRQTDGRSRSRE